MAIRVAARFQVAREFPSEKALRNYLRDHPQADKSKHTVSDGKDEPKSEEKKPSLKERLTAILKSVPEKAKQFVEDATFRKEALSKAVTSVKKSPEKFATNALKHIKKEGEAFKIAGQGVKAALSGKPLSKAQKKAVKTVARDIALTVAVTALTGGVAGLAHKSALSFVTALAKKISLNAVTDDFGDLITNLETAKGAASGVFQFFTKLSKKDDPHEILAQLVTAQVVKELGKFSEEDMVAAIEKLANRPQ